MAADLTDDFESNPQKQITSNYLGEATEVDGIRILTAPKKTIGEDFHVVIRHNDTIYLLIADGAGQGVSAATPGLRFPNLFSELAQQGHSIITIASKLNDELYQHKHQGYLITLTLVEINEYDGIINVLNCGNPTALLINESGELLHRFESTSLACGIVENEHYERLVEQFNYTQPARLYVATDGLYDTLIQHETHSETEYEALYQTAANKCFDTICTYVEKAHSIERPDDITLVEIDLTLPQVINKAKRKAPPLTEDEIIGLLSNCRILYVDPDLDSQQQINNDLRRYVDGLYLCGTVEEAVEAHHNYDPTLLIIDLTFLLEHQSGLNQILPDKDLSIPIIITCKPSNVILAEELFSLPITRYLRKPHIKSELLSKIIDCLKLSSNHENWQYNYAVFQESSLAMTITDAKQRIIRVNDAFCNITGYKKDELINRNPKVLSSGKHDAQFYRRMWHSINTTGHWSGEIWNKKKNGELFLEWITINAIKNQAGEVVSYCSVFSDITERKAVDEAIKRLSNYDDLTELANRRLFKTALKNRIEKIVFDHTTDSLAILFLDLDKFKEINDTLGHEYGDLVLIEASRRLKQCIRDTDLIARLGGDEFTICLTPNEANSINIVTKKILNEMANIPFLIKDEMIHLSVSIGVALYPNHGSDVSSLLKHADQAMFYAKEQGRNRVKFFTPSMETEALEKRALIHDLHLAVANKQFELFYQPIIELQTNSLHKAEALIRWHHPEKGLISPDKFIPLAEETGLITQIGDWVFEQAVSQSKHWRAKIHKHFQISINKSPKQFGRDKQHHKQWLNHLSHKQLPAEGIAVEITEGLLMDSKEIITDELLSFREKGIQVSLDDFGTGHSSLAYLRKFDIDYLKIDRQFVKQVETNSDDRALCQAIISMAHTLGLKVIAEGIETEGQKEFFIDCKCDYGQGYLFSRPVTSELFEDYFVKNYQ
jgi:diguanylate cyclase (GGDEF)-like protein/PAS domain S-box-containing protein